MLSVVQFRTASVSASPVLFIRRGHEGERTTTTALSEAQCPFPGKHKSATRPAEVENPWGGVRSFWLGPQGSFLAGAVFEPCLKGQEGLVKQRDMLGPESSSSESSQQGTGRALWRTRD